MKVAIVGSRTFTDMAKFEQIIGKIRDLGWGESWFVSGGSNGVDKLAEKYATSYGITMSVYKADWGKILR